MKNLMRPGQTMVSGRSRLTFAQKKKSLQSTSFNIRNKVFCVLLLVLMAIIIVFCVIYFDVALHSDLYGDPQTQSIHDIIIEAPKKSSNINLISNQQNDAETEEININGDININYDDISITSRTGYLSTLDLENANFLNLLHRRSLGFDIESYTMMHDIIDSYVEYANKMISADIESGELNGKYIIITPAAQMCNRMRAFMGTMLLGILTKRVVFIDIGAEGYAARFNHIFKSLGYEWEYKSTPSALHKMISSTGNKQKWTFPYEWGDRQRAVNGVILSQICDVVWIENDKSVWFIASHAAYLPLMARNKNLYQMVLQRYNTASEYKFDYNLANYFLAQIGNKGQEYIEDLEVLLGRFLFKLESKMQSAVDDIIRETYESALTYYTAQGIDTTEWNMVDNPPPVIGIHIRSEYVLLMNPRDCPGKNIHKCHKPYTWYEECGIAVMDKYLNGLLDGIKPYLFVAADTKEAQSAAKQIFGEDRVYYRAFGKTGSSFEGIQEAVIDLICVSSFDAFVGTPHSSYSEMASVLSQARRLYNDKLKTFEFKWKYEDIARTEEHLVPLNRMVIPMLTTVGWEIEKLNKYTMGTTIDIDLDDENKKILVPESNENRPNYAAHKVCKQSITAGMGWMGLFLALKSAHCYDSDWHHPSHRWFPIANK